MTGDGRTDIYGSSKNMFSKKIYLVMDQLKEAIKNLHDGEYLLAVDKKKYRVFVYDCKGGIVEKKGYDCGLGMKDWPTPAGLFRIDIKFHKGRDLSESSVEALKGHKLEDSFDKFYYNHFYFGFDWKGDKKRRIGWYPNRDDPKKQEYVSLAIHGAINEEDIANKKNVSHGCVWMRKKDIEDILDKNYIAKNKETWILIE